MSPPGTCWRSTPVGAQLFVRVQPGASASRIAGTIEDAAGNIRLKVFITAPPEGGKANAAIVKMLAKALRVPKSAIAVDAGANGRNKTLTIVGVETSALGALAP